MDLQTDKQTEPLMARYWELQLGLPTDSQRVRLSVLLSDLLSALR